MEIQWLMLADAAEVVANKLYIMGGGWEVLTVNTPFPVARHCSVAVAVRVPWQETNQQSTLDIEVATEFGQTLGKITGHFEVGRPPGVRTGQDQLMKLAVNLDLNLEGPGRYFVIGNVNGQASTRMMFQVIPGPLLAASGSTGGGPST